MYEIVDGHRTYYEQRGAGPHLLFIHGLGGASPIWFAQVETLSSRFLTTAYDWPGSGCSVSGTEEQTVESLAKHMSALCRRLDISRAGVVAHSMGAAVAITLAAHEPDLVAAMALLGPVTKLGAAGVDAINKRAAAVRELGMEAVVDAIPMGALAPKTRDENPAVHALFRASLLTNDPESYARDCEALIRADADALAPSVKAPTLLIGGSSDPTAPPASLQALASRLADAETVELPDAGHAMQLDQPQLVSANLERFFEGRI